MSPRASIQRIATTHIGGGFPSPIQYDQIALKMLALSLLLEEEMEALNGDDRFPSVSAKLTDHVLRLKKILYNLVEDKAKAKQIAQRLHQVLVAL